MLNEAWNWYNSLSMKSILLTGILTWMALSVILLDSWFLVVYVAAHCLTTGIFIGAMIWRMPESNLPPRRGPLKYISPQPEVASRSKEQRFSA